MGGCLGEGYLKIKSSQASLIRRVASREVRLVRIFVAMTPRLAVDGDLEGYLLGN